ncbi:MAG: DNA methyltransferase [Lacunisphaera sp.]|nr:DNA methyltransferase [Lacunisphaera sp.]
MRLILHKNFKWAALSRRVRREQRNREDYSPTISTYRWWARRSHALIGALIEQAQQALGRELVVSDPMAGGGTVAVEAARRGLRVHAQDVNPWAAFGLETTLRPVDPKLVEQAAEVLVARLRRASRTLYRADAGQDLVGRLHVRSCACPACAKSNYLFPTTLVALDERIVVEPKAGWFGCPACGQTHHAKWPKGPQRCPACDYGYGKAAPDARRIVDSAVTCAHCAAPVPLGAEELDGAKWHHVLSLTSDGRSLGLARPTQRLPKLRRAAVLGKTLRVAIPEQGETGALRRNGFAEWSDLFPDRQMALLDEAFSALNVPSIPEAVRRRLLLAVAGFAEMAGYACRWDPKYRKVYEVTANHHYTRALLAAETNPAGRLGRGTIARRLECAVKAARWFNGSAKASVTCGSSEKQPMADRSVDLVITDPPYYDSVQYAELSRLFRVFAKGLGLPWTDAVERKEAVPNRALGCSHEEYIARLRGIFAETRRTLKPAGRMLLTFHDNKVAAWQAVADALRGARWHVVSVAVVHSENEKDFAKVNTNAITVDAVFECVRAGRQPPRRIATAGELNNNSARNVLAMGAAVAAYTNSRSADLGRLYRDRARRRGIKKLTID